MWKIIMATCEKNYDVEKHVSKLKYVAKWDFNPFIMAIGDITCVAGDIKVSKSNFSLATILVISVRIGEHETL